MHELGLMQEAVRIAIDEATSRSASSIRRLGLRVGMLSGVVPESLAFAFDVVTHGTIAQGAALDLESAPIVCACSACGLEFTSDDIVFECPACCAPGATMLRGRELELAYVEVA